ncbi:biopolymer transport protein ExbD [Ereboglobus sp. PH5-5]|uniref:Biopolymer transporter ExbD n=1 Tax=Ereboglobus luteus TaxID=1796921 RepID=A0A2U8E3R3_9BACT|nr:MULTISPECIES: biopolymer transporter ExbD [Ereboglobus]AWI09430.1 biopolymer transporter ExbD [Ereboglobus luteus]MDF9833458.1 biopolymer transport protein ExbD [Ereboglobus sp. PH5-5]
MSATGLRVKRRHRPELPLVPLIDVLVLLVFFAFVTMRFANTQTLNLTLPKVDTAGSNQFNVEGVTIAIEKDGTILFGGKPATEAQLVDLLQQVKQVSRDIPVLISADEDTPLKTLAFVMDACRKTGLNKFSLQSR